MICRICGEKSYARGLCNRHYKRWRLYGEGGPANRFNENHGMSKTKAYVAWANMKKRCGDPRHPKFRYYGGRGIHVCEEWAGSFSTFLADMGNPPTPRHWIDRIDNDKGYTKGNCRWVSPAKNLRNRPSVKLNIAKVLRIRFAKSKGARTTELARIFGVSQTTIRAVIRNATWKEQLE